MKKVCVHLPYGNALTIETDVYTTGLYVQVQPGIQYDAVALDADDSILIGPFDEARDYEIEYDVNQPTLTNEQYLVAGAKAYTDTVQAGLIADGVTEWQAGIEQDISDLQGDDGTSIHTSNTVADLTALNEDNIAAITDTGELALVPNTIAAVNDILAILIAAGLMAAPE